MTTQVTTTTNPWIYRKPRQFGGVFALATGEHIGVLDVLAVIFDRQPQEIGVLQWLTHQKAQAAHLIAC